LPIEITQYQSGLYTNEILDGILPTLKSVIETSTGDGLSLIEDIEDCFERGWTDGLPVVPPYPRLTDTMLGALGWKSDEVIATMEQVGLEIHGAQVAAAAVMAGCLPDYAKILRPLAELLFEPAFNLQGVATTTGGAAIAVVVSGPVVSELGFHHGANVLGAPTRINATVGRFAGLLRRFHGLAGGELESFGAIGHPGQITFCVPEHPRHWAPFHTQVGIAEDQSAVTIFAAEGPNSVNNHYAETGSQILETIAHCMAHSGTTNFYLRRAGYTVVIAPEHMDLIAQSFSRDEAQSFILEHAQRSTHELIRLGRIPPNPRDEYAVDPDAPRCPVRSRDQITFIEAGAPTGKFSAVIPHWVASVTRSRVIGA
jgi:hypothetical protein